MKQLIIGLLLLIYLDVDTSRVTICILHVEILLNTSPFVILIYNPAVGYAYINLWSPLAASTP